MAAAAVAQPLSAMSMQLTGKKTGEKEEENLYLKMKELEQALEFVSIQETYLKDEMKNLKREMIRAKE